MAQAILSVQEIVEKAKSEIAEARSKGEAFGANTRVKQEKLMQRFVVGPYKGYTKAGELLKK